MRKYKIIVEAELVLDDNLDTLNLLDFNKNKIISQSDNSKNKYKLYLDLYKTT